MGAVKGSDIASLPTLWEVLSRGDPTERSAVLDSALLGLLPLAITLCIAWRHQTALAAAPPSQRRSYYRIVQLFPVPVAFTCFFQILLPRLALGTLLAQEIWEAVALHYFALTMIDLLGGVDETVKSLAPETPQGMFGSSNRWCTPPCCCLVPALPCLFRDGRRKFDLRMLSKLMSMIEQYCYVAPLTAGLSILVDISGIGGREELHPGFGFVEFTAPIVQTVSMVICLQSIFVLYKTTKHQLKRYDTTRKFAGIKVIIMLSALQKAVVVYFVSCCMVTPDGSLYSERNVATRLQAFLLAYELPFVQALLNAGFTQHELLADETQSSDKLVGGQSDAV